VLLSGLLWHGPPHALLEQVRTGLVTLISSPALLAELDEVIRRPKFQTILARSHADPKQMMSELRRLMEIVDPPPLQAAVTRDPDDDAALAVAVASRADVVISGDADLLSLGDYAGIPIIDPAAAVTRIGRE
jgi:putative PIN family toxin of toxin-antitoxin system